MEIKKITRFNERAFEAVSRLLPQLSSDAELLTRQYFKSILASESIHFFIAELDKRQIVGMLTIATVQNTLRNKSLDRRCCS